MCVCLTLVGCTGDGDNNGGFSDHLQESIIQGISALSGEDQVEEVENVSTARPEGGISEADTKDIKFRAYRIRKERDPFQPLLTEGGEMLGLTLSAMILTGILWDDQQSLAVMEDNRGRGYLLRVGDEIAGARLVAIRKDAAVFRVVEFGVVHSVEKELFIEEERPI
jgi:hypothetical protein